MNNNTPKKKLTLEDLEVDSFVTTIDEFEQEELLGGAIGPHPHPPSGCPRCCRPGVGTIGTID
jgi:hypothetical protein